jgi:hypothetical protein
LPKHWYTFHVQSLLGGALVAQEQYPAAEPLLLMGHDGLKVRASKIPFPFHYTLAGAAERLVRLYQATDRPGDADRWARVLAEYRRQDGQVVERIHEVGPKLTLTGRLAPDAPGLIYQLRLKGGTPYVIEMTTPDPNACTPYLDLRNSNGKSLLEAAPKAGFNARLLYYPSAAGLYRVRAAASNNGHGEFTLTVREKE